MSPLTIIGLILAQAGFSITLAVCIQAPVQATFQPILRGSKARRLTYRVAGMLGMHLLKHVLVLSTSRPIHSKSAGMLRSRL